MLVMMIEHLHGCHRPILRGHLRRESRRRAVSRVTTASRRVATRSPGTVWLPVVRVFDRTALMTAIRQIAKSIRRWRRRVGAQQQLRDLNDYLLKDIGLRREEVLYQVEKRGDARWTR
jgi:uncharacterized protein YjiS (DUF1127 family)